MKVIARAVVLLLIALASVPILILGLAAALVLLLYALLEELADSTAGVAPIRPHNGRQ